MRALGLDREEDLFLLMAHGHLPMPRLADAATGEMVEQLRALPSHRFVVRPKVSPHGSTEIQALGKPD